MRLSAVEAGGQPDDVPLDLLWGISPRHIRRLCDNPWNGGLGYTPAEVGDMTLDQIFMLLADPKVLRASNRMRTQKVKPQDTALLRSRGDGTVAARDREGRPIVLRHSGGKSKAQQIQEEIRQRKQAQSQGAAPGRRKRRRRHGD